MNKLLPILAHSRAATRKPAPAYPACPEREIWNKLLPTRRVGAKKSEKNSRPTDQSETSSGIGESDGCRGREKKKFSHPRKSKTGEGRSIAIQANSKQKAPPNRKKFVPPRKLSAREIREEFKEQDRKILETIFFDDMDRPGQTGYLLLNEEGAVLSSSGDLENDEKSAVIIMGLVNLTSQIDPVAFPPEEGFKKLSIVYEDHCYIICLSNRRIHIVKKTLSPDSAHTIA
ncbi:hypothetical protein NQ317_011636 [Molorchus minor]|uniref:Late endosomal/lysosomal adaptor and MAPK and MTOR activator 4 n=1 Tax=Molorchus minor TaxID=1323400 RepID=A0ABQ9JAT3_9CUCU|nr:hypothetical protein NQ317_011636 [Molorchus minor]